MAGVSPSDQLIGGSGGGSPEAVLDLCDGLLEEIGRRRHLFAWLRLPDAPPGEWLAVDAYYPARRLVVMCRPLSEVQTRLCDELVPGHGLRLLRVDSDDLGDDPRATLSGRIESLELPPREIFDLSVGTPTVRDSAVSRMSASLVQAASPPARQRARPRPPHRPGAAVLTTRPREEASVAAGVVLGVALAVVLGIELFVGVGEVALGGNHWLLAFGLALDAAARALGTVAGERAGRLDLVMWSVIGGSPAVAAFTLFGREGRMTVEPAPIAGLTGVAAMTAIGLWIGGSLLGL